jgi:hypothetical protein
MYNCIVKKVLFCGVILLWVASASYGCNDGPCLSTLTDCGYPTEMGTCVWDGSGCGGGECGRRCPGTADHWACWGWYGSCTESWVICAEWEQPICIIQGTPGGCRCTDGVPQGIYCSRMDC